jgi:hypothetical protein
LRPTYSPNPYRPTLYSPAIRRTSFWRWSMMRPPTFPLSNTSIPLLFPI